MTPNELQIVQRIKACLNKALDAANQDTHTRDLAVRFNSATLKADNELATLGRAYTRNYRMT